MTIDLEPHSSVLGEPLPPHDPHAISVSLPRYQDAVDWANREDKLLATMRTGYPRFYIHRAIDALAGRIIKQFGSYGLSERPIDEVATNQKSQRKAMLFPYQTAAFRCTEFIARMSQNSFTNLTVLKLSFASKAPTKTKQSQSGIIDWGSGELYAVLYPTELFAYAKAFWQHTGFGIASRYATFYHDSLEEIQCISSFNEEEIVSQIRVLPTPIKQDVETLDLVEYNGGRVYKDKLRRHIANLISTDATSVNHNNVLLYCSGMSMLTNVIDAIYDMEGDQVHGPIMAYGFLYVDTFKVISRIHKSDGFQRGHCSTAELDELESQLNHGYRISAVFCEFPGNPLLITPDLRRLRRLADEFDFIIVCDDTVGTFINVDVLHLSDVVCTSLSKMFSGGCNAMGGSLVLNPYRKHYNMLHLALKRIFVDAYYPDDAQVMESNSRDFEARMHKSNKNAEMVVDLLTKHPAVTHVYYPKIAPSRNLYDAFKKPGGGYSYLVSAKFLTPSAATSFFDNLDVAKGPSLGTNFTLSCPYTLFSHWGEREWAASYGVTQYMIRISVGIEDEAILRVRIQDALDAVNKVEEAAI